MKTLLVALALLGIGWFCSVPSVIATGEIFKVEATGTQYCPNGYSKFNASNNLDFWIYMISGYEIQVSLSPNFEPSETFSIYLTAYPIDSKRVSYIGGTYIDDYTYIGMQGISKMDKYGDVANSKGTFMWSNWFYADCFASGKFKTVERLQ